MSLSDLVIAHLRKHPDDELGASDIGAQFRVRAVEVDALLASAVASGVLNRRRGRGDHEPVFMAGPRIAASPAAAPGAAASAPAVPPMPAARKKRVQLQALDLTAVDVHDDVPLPDAKRGPRHTEWRVLFERLTKPGLCSSPLPIEHKNSLKNAAAAWAKDRADFKFAIRAISDTHIRIWRTE